MANEIAIPLLPCRSIDEMADFYDDARFHAGPTTRSGRTRTWR